MKKYMVEVKRRNSAFSTDWHSANPIIIEARNQTAAENKLDKLARKMNNDYCRLGTEVKEV